MTYVTRLRGAGLSPTDYQVLMTIWTYSDQNMHNAFPSVSSLEKDTGHSRRTVQRSLNALRDKGFLTVSKPGGNVDGKNRATRYRLTLPVRGGVTHDAPERHTRRPGGVTDDAVSDPGSDHVSGPSIARPSQAMSPNVAGSILTDHPLEIEDTSSADRADAADPVGPEWRRSPERAQMIQAVRDYARLYHSFDHTSMDGIDEWIEQREQIESWFDSTLEDTLGAEMHIFSAAANDRGWTPPKRVIDSNFEAGVWLNKLLHWLQGHDDAYAGQFLSYTGSAA